MEQLQLRYGYGHMIQKSDSGYPWLRKETKTGKFQSHIVPELLPGEYDASLHRAS
jgi:hypothetical protein